MKLNTGLLALLCAAASMSAATISVTYANTQVPPTQDPITGATLGSGSGTVAPLGSMTWRDMGFSDSTGTLFAGTFAMTFSNGTLFGNLNEQIDLSGAPTAIVIKQMISVTGGTGAFAWYNGLITTSGTLSATSTQALFSGTGTLNTTPEPGSLALLPLGLAGLYLIRRKAT